MKYHFNITDSDFWDLGMPELNALVKRYEEEEKVKDKRAALICMVLANCHRDPKKKTFKIEDFMPKVKKDDKLKALPKSQSADEMIFSLRAWNAAAGGKEVIHDGH